MPETVIIGLGNPVLADDSVGLKAAAILKDKLSGKSSFDVVMLYSGGIRLLDVLSGYERAIIIDAMVTGTHRPGSVLKLSPGDILQTHNSVSIHDINLPAALELGRMLGIPLPSDIIIFGIEAGDVQTFSESLSPIVANVISEVVAMVEIELDI